MKLLVFDSENAGGFWDTATKIWCVCIYDMEEKQLYKYGPDQIEEALDHLNRGDVLIGHNIIGHDFPVIRRLHKRDFKHKKIVDTLLVSRQQRPNRSVPPHCPVKHAPHSVEAWGYRLGHRKVDHDDWENYSPEMLHRCGEDVLINVKIYEALIKEGKGEGWGACHRLNMRLFDYLKRQEEHGWFVDTAHMDRCCHQLRRWILRIDMAIVDKLPLLVEPQETKQYGEFKYIKKPFKKDGSYAKSVTDWFGDSLDSMVGGPFSRVAFRRVSLDSNLETKDFLIKSGWEPLEWNYSKKTGEVTSPKLSKDDPFIGVQGSLGKLIVLRVKCKHRLSTIEGLKESVREDGTIRPGIGGVASTGRIRHSVIVNIPSVDSGSFYGKQMRSIFRARPGMVMVGADSAGNQIRQLAARMGDPEFTKVVLFGKKETGDDLHSFNQQRANLPTRTLAKNFFYGFIFGAQDAKIGKIMGKDKAAGAAIREEYYRRVPKLKELVDRLTEEWKATAVKWYNPKWNKWEYRDGYITGLDGRPILVDSEHKILNYALQSDEAIQLGWGYVYVHEEMERRGYVQGVDWHMLIWYHDEYQAECRPSIKETLGQIMCDAIRIAGEHYNIQCPHAGEYKIGNNWADTH